MGLQVWLPLSGNTKQYGLSNITMIGSPSNWVNGKIGQCAHFDGNISNVIYNNTTDFNYTDNFSWAVWIKTNFTGTTAQYAFTNGRADAGGYGYGIQCVSSANCYVRFGNQGYTIPVTGGEWTHLAFTKIGSLITIYKNGSIYSSQTFNGTLPTYSDGNGLGLGCFHYSGNIYPFYGDLNDFRIYDHCLSPREVKEVSKGLVLHYSLAMPGQENLTPCGGIYTQSNPRTTTFNKTDGNSWIPNSAFEGTPSTTYTISVQCDGTLSNAHGIGGLSPADKPWSFWLYICNTDTSKSWQTGSYDTPINLNSSNHNYRKIGNTHVWTYTLSSTQKYISLRTNSYSDGTTNVTVNWWNIKVEKGDTFTPWIPSTSSELYTALGFNDGIEYDVSGYQHNGTKVGTITYDSDTPRYNTSAKFTDNSYIKHKLPEQMYYATYSFWVKASSYTNYGAIYITFGSPGSGYSPWLSVNTESCKVWAHFGNNSPNYTKGASGSVTTNEWHHCVYVWDNGVAQWYLDGEKCGNAVTYTGRTYIQNTNNATIGNSYTGTNWNGTKFNGQISDFRIYSTALSADDILELYHTPETLSHNGTLLAQGEFVES